MEISLVVTCWLSNVLVVVTTRSPVRAPSCVGEGGGRDGDGGGDGV